MWLPSHVSHQTLWKLAWSNSNHFPQNVHTYSISKLIQGQTNKSDDRNKCQVSDKCSVLELNWSWIIHGACRNVSASVCNNSPRPHKSHQMLFEWIMHACCMSYVCHISSPAFRLTQCSRISAAIWIWVQTKSHESSRSPSAKLQTERVCWSSSAQPRGDRQCVNKATRYFAAKFGVLPGLNLDCYGNPECSILNK